MTDRACSYLNKFLQLAMNGPWKVLELLDSDLEGKYFTKTISIGSCRQHIVHAALKTGTTNTEWTLDKILKAMFYVLSDSPARGNDYINRSGTDIFPLLFAPPDG